MFSGDNSLFSTLRSWSWGTPNAVSIKSSLPTTPPSPATMTHVLPEHAMPPVDMDHSGIQPTFQMEQQPTTPQPATSGKKRRKADGQADDAPHTPAEPRRLRRSHEACARCRSKKIKASAVGRSRPLEQRNRKFPGMLTLSAASPTVRLEAPKVYGVRQRWRHLRSRGPIPPDAHAAWPY